MVMRRDLMPPIPRRLLGTPRRKLLTAKAAMDDREERRGIEPEKLDFDSNMRCRWTA
jgi:hypothetical protein